MGKRGQFVRYLHVEELRDYFNPKVEEGKNKMSIINCHKKQTCITHFCSDKE